MPYYWILTDYEYNPDRRQTPRTDTNPLLHGTEMIRLFLFLCEWNESLFNLKEETRLIITKIIKTLVRFKNILVLL